MFARRRRLRSQADSVANLPDGSDKVSRRIISNISYQSNMKQSDFCEQKDFIQTVFCKIPEKSIDEIQKT